MLVDSDVIDLHGIVVSLVIPRPLPVPSGVEEFPHCIVVPVPIAPRLLQGRVSAAIDATVRDEAVRSSNGHVQNEMELRSRSKQNPVKGKSYRNRIN